MSCTCSRSHVSSSARSRVLKRCRRKSKARTAASSSGVNPLSRDLAWISARTLIARSIATRFIPRIPSCRESMPRYLAMVSSKRWTVGEVPKVSEAKLEARLDRVPARLSRLARSSPNGRPSTIAFALGRVRIIPVPARSAAAGGRASGAGGIDPLAVVLGCGLEAGGSGVEGGVAQRFGPGS